MILPGDLVKSEGYHLRQVYDTEHDRLSDIRSWAYNDETFIVLCAVKNIVYVMNHRARGWIYECHLSHVQ